jgi:response regulator RpfG family c-di-GMP phosphodiesterase
VAVTREGRTARLLSSLRRLFRPHGYRVLVAESGPAGLAILEQEPVDLVISDMRMPEMDGALFLEQVRTRWPDTVRLLLTGYSDVQSILAAINRGEIHRYITKPWDDNDILLIVRHALERRALEQLAARQNEELRQLNLTLEAKVEARTLEIGKANERLKANFTTTIKILASAIEMRDAQMAGSSRRVADLSRRIASRMGLDAKDTQEVFIAGLLHDIGKIGFPDDVLTVPFNTLSGDKLGLFRRHPVRAAELLMPLDDLKGVAEILASQAERFDGQGFPAGLTGFSIPLGARIVALAADFDNLQHGVMVQQKLRPDQAKQLVYDSSGKRYDPAVVDAFRELMDGAAPEVAHDVAKLTGELEPGMQLSRDLVTREGLMLLPADHVLEERMIEQLCDYESKCDYRLSIRVWPQKENK